MPPRRHQIPLVPGLLWENKKLINTLKYINRYPLTVIQAPMGYGKSTNLAYSLAKDYQENVIWYQVRPGDNHFNDFFTNIYYALLNNRMIKEGFELKIEECLAGVIDLDQLQNSFINFIDKEVEEDIYLVLDNYENIQRNNHIIHQNLASFLEKIPHCFHIIIISRGSIPLNNLSFWLLEEKALIVKQDILSLSAEQIEELFQERYGLEISPEESKQLYQETEGMVLALHYLATQHQTGISLDELLTDKANYLGDLYNYFSYKLANEINRYRQFLLKTSIFDRMEVSICNKLLDDDRSAEILQELVDLGLFIFEIRVDGESKYRYHRLFQGFLQQLADKEYGLARLHQQAKKIYLTEKRFHQVLEHAFELRQKDQLAELIINNGDNWLKNRRLDLLGKGLALIQEESFSHYPELYIYLGDLYYYQDHFELALDKYQQAERLIEIKRLEREQGNLQTNIMIKTLFRISWLYIMVGHTNSHRYLEKLASYQNSFGSEQLEEFIQYKVCEKLTIQRNVREVEQLLEKYRKSMTDYQSLQEAVFFMKGELDEAFKLIMRPVEEQTGQTAAAPHFIKQVILPVLIYLFRGQVYQALEYIWIKREECYGIERKTLDFYLWMCYRLLGNPWAYHAGSKFKEMINYYHKDSGLFSDSWMKGEALLEKICCEIFYGSNTEIIEGYIEQGYHYARQRHEDSTYSYLKLWEGVYYHLQGQYKKAEECILRSREICLANGDYLHHAGILVWLMLNYYQQGKKNKAFQALGELLEEENHNYVLIRSTLVGVDDPARLISLLLECRERRKTNPIIERLLNEMNLGGISRHPGYSLRITAFGPLKIFRDGKELIEEDWKRKKARDLLVILLVNLGEYLHRDKICSLLWTDLDLDSAINNFNVNLSQLNNLLEPSRRQGEDPFFIIKKGLSYQLRSGVSLKYDVQGFEDLVKRGRKTSDMIIRMEYFRLALGYYQGEFIFNDLYNDWVLAERDRLTNIYIQISDELMRYYFQQECYAECIEISKAILESNKYYEAAYLYQMKSFAAGGRRPEAVKIYLSCQRILTEELNINPSREINEFYRSITI